MLRESARASALAKARVIPRPGIGARALRAGGAGGGHHPPRSKLGLRRGNCASCFATPFGALGRTWHTPQDMAEMARSRDILAALLRKSSRGRKVLENRNSYHAWMNGDSVGNEDGRQLTPTIALVQHHIDHRQSKVAELDERIEFIQSAIEIRESVMDLQARMQREAANIAAVELAAAERAATAERVAQARAEKVALEQMRAGRIAADRAAHHRAAQQLADDRMAAERMAQDDRMATERMAIEKATAKHAAEVHATDVADDILQLVAQRVTAAREAARACGETAAVRTAALGEAQTAMDTATLRAKVAEDHLVDAEQVAGAEETNNSMKVLDGHAGPADHEMATNEVASKFKLAAQGTRCPRA